MILRKTRTHHTGNSNLASRPGTARPVTQPGQTRLDFLSTAKGKFMDTHETKTPRNVQTPFESTKTFYDQHGKPQRMKTQVSFPRTLLLEDPDKMKMPFTGESHLIHDKNLEKYREYDSPAFVDKIKKELLDKEHLAKEKHEAHAQAIQETQLVGYDKYSADTLKNNVNLEKVREAKRVLRRKYGNRVNMHRIFQAWDSEKKGRISAENFFTMAKKLGLNLNYDESRVLIATADKSATGNLTLDEFFDLVNNKDDALNVDLDHISKYVDANYLLQKERLEDDNVIKRLEENARKARETKHMNQVTLILKNKLPEIALGFNLIDPNRKGYTTYDCFEQNIKKLGLDSHLISENDIKALFKKNTRDNHTINYRTFLENLKNFNFYYEEAYKEHENQPHSVEIKQYVSAPAPVKKEEGISIVDIKNVPYSTVYTFLGKKRRISRLIQKFFPKKQDLKTYFSQTLNLPLETAESHVLSQKEAKDAVMNLFKKLDINNLSNRDFEGFLSTFIYNKHHETEVKEILNGIYEEDEEELIAKINGRRKGPAPQKSALELNPNVGEIDIVDSKILRNCSSARNISDFNPRIAGKRDINSLLKMIDDNIFVVGKKKYYDIFKMFDVDKDGFISRKDFMTKAEEIDLVPKEDIPTLVNYLDSENKGYVNFTEFHKKIRCNVTQQDEQGQPTVLPFVIPSKENFHKVNRFGPESKRKLDDIISELKPDNYSTLRPASRFGQAPAWKNTFTNIQPSLTSPMFIAEHQRFDRTPQASVIPSSEDKARKIRIQSAKIENLKHRQETIAKRVEQDTLKQDNLEQSRLKTKLIALNTHEYNARLRNNF